MGCGCRNKTKAAEKAAESQKAIEARRAQVKAAREKVKAKSV